MSYTPPARILEKYADLLVNFALGSGKGIKPGELVYLQVPLSAQPLYVEIVKKIIDSGGLMPIGGLSDNSAGLNRYFFEKANKHQLTTFLDKYNRGLVDQMDHRLVILSDYDMHELKSVDPAKFLSFQKSRKPMMDWLDAKERNGKYSWTGALYGTASMAKEAGLSEKAYWDQIIKACYLDKANPIAEWRKIVKELERVGEKLNNLKIQWVHIEGPDADLKIQIGSDRRWVSGRGANVPSFEVFTSPNWRGTEGWIRFNQPLYHYSNMIKGIELVFKAGRVVKASAKQNQRLLDAMLATDKGAAQLGEFSMTDKRLSRITKFMAETLFDENVGGKYGNTHIAVGKSFHEASSAPKKLSEKALQKAGFNTSAIHNDMISTTDRTITATLPDGSQKVIYKNGQFTV